MQETQPAKVNLMYARTVVGCITKGWQVSVFSPFEWVRRYTEHGWQFSMFGLFEWM
jgi:hypothetical protein